MSPSVLNEMIQVLSYFSAHIETFEATIYRRSSCGGCGGSGSGGGCRCSGSGGGGSCRGRGGGCSSSGSGCCGRGSCCGSSRCGLKMSCDYILSNSIHPTVVVVVVVVVDGNK